MRRPSGFNPLVGWLHGYYISQPFREGFADIIHWQLYGQLATKPLGSPCAW